MMNNHRILKCTCAVTMLCLMSAVASAQELSKNPAIGRENGHEWVDLGLSVKWATCNVGAVSPASYGNYYAWGETSTKSDYGWGSLKYCTDTSSDHFNKYVLYSQSKYWSGSGGPDNKTRLDLSDDAARQNWGGDWRTPTMAEWEELDTKCTWTWTTRRGKNGYEVTGKNGNSIFLPAAGYFFESSLLFDGSRGNYWSSSLSTDGPFLVLEMCFGPGGHRMCGSRRDSGQSVRPVID